MKETIAYLKEQVSKIGTLEDSLARIADSTERTAEYLERIDTSIRDLRGDLVDAATSKNSVPTRVFIYSLFIFGVIVIVERVTNSGTNLHVNERGLHIEQQTKAIPSVLRLN